jgi:Fe2+ or Zn2+ uptake regulation protein
MSCHKYHVDIELLPSLDEDTAQFQQAVSHIQQCPRCWARYQTARELDEVLAAKLNEPAPPPSFTARIINQIQCSLMPAVRRAILEKIKSTTIHPPADWVHMQLKQHFPRLTLRTVCRHLGVLKNDGDVLELDFGEGFKRFDGNLEPHSHFICQQCRSVYDICQPSHQLINLSEIRNICHKVLEHSLKLQGICRRCRTE